ncbi:putative transposase [Planktothrix agardhii CCAP 1459/11A]|jgi:DDE_Tnp_1-associated|uniref:Putative transposase n=1 Tax=Planktothrix agardhii CCAP 1459/11A TaxID=282420 RepID=A0A4V0XUZ7_PLAAG|nr:transposase family protein [Planktothrix agardhii]GDZ95579.1 putative transposase [Planktothrix agardhii CCAP 1459/11A]
MLTTLIEKLKKVKDYRKAQGTRHPLWLVLLIVILGLMQRNLGYRELENFAKINQKELSQVVKIKLEKLPSYSTRRRVVEGVDWSNLIEIFNEMCIKPEKTLVINLFRSWGFVSITEGQRWLTDHWHKIFIISELFPLKSSR